MSTLKGATLSPFVVFGAAVVAFACWIACDALSAAAPADASAERDYEVEAADAPPVEALITNLKPGMSRAATEEHLMSLASPEVDPVDTSGGKPVIRERYLVDLGQPVAPLGAEADEFVPGVYVLTLEFDGAADGNPMTHFSLDPAPPH